MKLPDFTNDAQMNSLRNLMGAPLGDFTPAVNRDVLTAAEIEALTSQGIDVSLDDVYVLPDGTLAYKNSRVILYIRDVVSYGNDQNRPRFHVADCRTLISMRANNRFERYVVATRDDGLFLLNIIKENEWSGNSASVTEKLSVCQHCLIRLRWDGFQNNMSKQIRHGIVEDFSISRLFNIYGKTLIANSPKHTAGTAPINIYASNFSEIGGSIKKNRKYICDSCNINLSDHKKFLHAHHKNGLKYDDRPENLETLCIACHANEFNHNHMKGTPDYVEFLRIRSSINFSSNSKMEIPTPVFKGWVDQVEVICGVHNLKFVDLRKDGGCVWVTLKNPNHPAAVELRKLDFQFSVKRQAYWRKF